MFQLNHRRSSALSPALETGREMEETRTGEAVPRRWPSVFRWLTGYTGRGSRVSRAALGSIALLTNACSDPHAWLPIRSEPSEAAATTLVWAGRGECERYEAGTWQRRPEFDYEFTVEQRRNGARWESVKNLRRLHPNYDGSAGERTQTYYFDTRYQRSNSDRVEGEMRSSLGTGRVVTDPEFRSASIELRADVSAFAPFDRYRITQRYSYERGELDELVELTDGASPWVRNRERATLFAPQRFQSPPTRLDGPSLGAATLDREPP